MFNIHCQSLHDYIYLAHVFRVFSIYLHPSAFSIFSIPFPLHANRSFNYSTISLRMLAFVRQWFRLVGLCVFSVIQLLITR